MFYINLMSGTTGRLEQVFKKKYVEKCFKSRHKYDN